MGLEISGRPVALARTFGMAVQVGIDSRFPIGALESQISWRNEIDVDWDTYRAW